MRNSPSLPNKEGNPVSSPSRTLRRPAPCPAPSTDAPPPPQVRPSSPTPDAPNNPPRTNRHRRRRQPDRLQSSVEAAIVARRPSDAPPRRRRHHRTGRDAPTTSSPLHGLSPNAPRSTARRAAATTPPLSRGLPPDVPPPRAAATRGTRHQDEGNHSHDIPAIYTSIHSPGSTHHLHSNCLIRLRFAQEVFEGIPMSLAVVQLSKDPDNTYDCTV